MMGNFQHAIEILLGGLAALLTAAYHLSRWVAAAAGWPVVEQQWVEVELVDESALATPQEVMS